MRLDSRHLLVNTGTMSKRLTIMDFGDLKVSCRSCIPPSFSFTIEKNMLLPQILQHTTQNEDVYALSP